MTRRPNAVALAIVVVTVGGALPTVVAETGATHRVAVVTPSPDDERLGSVRDAVAFWNRTMGELGLDVRIVQTDLLVAPPETDALENYTRRIWELAGRLRPGMPGPPSPPELRGLDGDVVVFLSVQPTMSFAWPFDDATRHFVAVPAEPGSRSHRAGSTRNVIAHELGHTLGLTHQANPLVLMCSPCRPGLGWEDADGFLPLTDLDRRRLRRRFVRVARADGGPGARDRERGGASTARGTAVDTPGSDDDQR